MRLRRACSRPAPVGLFVTGKQFGSVRRSCAGPAAVLRRSWSGPETLGPVGCLYRGSNLVGCGGSAWVLHRIVYHPLWSCVGLAFVSVGRLSVSGKQFGRLRQFCLGPAPDSVSSSLVLRRPRICLSWSAVCIGEAIAPVLCRSCAGPASVLRLSIWIHIRVHTRHIWGST